MLPRLTATRYVLPLREGGSLPAIVDTDGDAQYVVKFLGAGQGPKALVAEAIAAGLAQVLSLPVPQPAVIDLGEGFGAGEPNPEIQDLLRGSAGANFGLAYVPAAVGFDVAIDLPQVDPGLAASIVWFDALLTNVDRTVRNPNLLLANGKLWLIDHGASLYFHHASTDLQGRAADRFTLIGEHILLPRAASLDVVHARMKPLLTDTALSSVLDDVPDEWLDVPAPVQRQRYVDYLRTRLDSPGWLQEAEDARKRLA